MSANPISTAPTVSVVVPARGEEQVLPATLPLVIEAVDRLTVPAEVVVVVPVESPFARRPPLTDPRLSWATVATPGKHEALRVGVRQACGDVLVFQDADVLPAAETFRRLVEALWATGADAVAGRIRLHQVGGSASQRLLEAWTAVGVDAWHRLRAERPDLRWALPGALYAVHRDWFPAGELLVPTLDDASIGLSMVERGARVAYAPQASVQVGAARSFAQWYRQKRRIRRGWKMLEEQRAEAVADLQAALSRYCKDSCQGRPDRHLLRLTDRTMAVLAERSRATPAERAGCWRPDRAGWEPRQPLPIKQLASVEPALLLDGLANLTPQDEGIT